MRWLKNDLPIPASFRIVIALAIAGTALSGCRLGANNSEKLSALKSGEIYAEEGIVTVEITSPAEGLLINSVSNSATYSASGTCHPEGTPISLRIDDSADSGAGVATCSNGAWSSSFDSIPLSDGVHSLVAVATRDGKEKLSKSVTFTKDAKIPNVAISSPSAGAYVNLANNSASFAISGTCDDSTATVQVKVDGSNSGSAASCSGANWNTTISTVGLAQGAHTLTAWISNAVGNSSTSAGISITQDTVVPTVALTYPVAGVIINSNTSKATFPVKGTCSENSRAVSILVDGATASSLASNTCSSGAFSATIDVTGLSNAAHTITATQTDAAGNSGPSTPPSVTVTKNTSLSLGGTFTRASVAYDPYTFVQAASGLARFPTVAGATGILIEEGTTNLMASGLENFTDAHWAKYLGANWVRTTGRSDPFGGTGAFRFVSTGGTSVLKTYADYATGTSGQLYSGQFRVKNNSAQALTTISNAGPGSNTVNSSDGWTHIKWPGMTSNGSGFFQIQLRVPTAADNLDVDLMNPMYELKAYNTSYTPPGTSRVDESLTIPTAGSIQGPRGGIIVRAYVAGDLLGTTIAPYRFLLDSAASATTGRVAFLKMGSNWRAQISSDSGVIYPITSSRTLNEGWHTFGLSWEGTTLKLWIDGNLENSSNAVTMPTSFGSNIQLGRYYGSANYYWNQPIDSIAFYQHAPSADEMVAYTTTGPTGADNQLDFNGAIFARTSAANDTSTGAQVASGVPRFATLNGQTGIVMEEATTNLLTANQSDIETDTTGFNRNAPGFPETISRDATEAWQGGSSIKTITTASSGDQGWYVTFSTTASQTYTASVYLKGTGVVRPVLCGSDTSPNVTLSTTSWTRVSATRTASGASCAFVVSTRGAQAVTFWSDGLQVEQKAYATSWQIGGTPRTVETLSVPTQGLFNKGAWTVSLDFTPTSNPVGRGTYGVLWQVSMDSDNYYVIGIHGTTGIPYVEVKSGGSYYGSYHASDSPLVAGTRYRITARGNGSQVTLWINGAKSALGDRTYSEPATTLPSTFVLGNTGSGSMPSDGVIDNFSLFSTALSDSTISGWGSASPPSGAALQLQFNRSLGQ